MAIRKVPLFVAYLIGIYLIGWTVAYVLAFGLDFFIMSGLGQVRPQLS